MLTATLKARIVKPLDCSWDDLGTLFRALRAPLHRVLNAAVTSIELSHAAQSDVHPQTVGYRAVRDQWTAEREAAKTRVEAKKGYVGDDAIARIKPHSAVVLGASGAVWARWGKWNKERWRGTMSLPSFRGGGPIYVASSNGAVEIEPIDGSAVLSLRLTLGGATRMVVAVDGPSAHAQLRRVLADSSLLGDCRIVQSRKSHATGEGKKSGWEVRLSVKREEETASGPRIMAVHRGMKSMLTVAIARSEKGVKDARTLILESGDDIIRHKMAYKARRRSMGRQLKQVGNGAKGHGTRRRMSCVRALEDAEQRYVRSKCQEAAAHVVAVAKRSGVGTILVEDWSTPAAAERETHIRQWPWAQLRECIDWACKRAGVVVQCRPGSTAITCPLCGSEGSAGNGVFLCSEVECRLERPLDVIFAWNMLRLEGLDVPNEEAVRAAKKARRKIRSAKS